jgi:hypothetical protein
MIGTLVASGLAAGIGAFMSARKKKKQQRMLAAQANENRNRYYEDVALSEQAKNWGLRRVQEQNERMNRSINNSAVATGATHENNLAAMQNAGNIYADAANTATAQQVQQQLNSKHNYENKQDEINAAQQQLASERGQMWATLGSNLAGSIVNAGVANAWFKNRQPTAEANNLSSMNDIEPLSVPQKFTNTTLDTQGLVPPQGLYVN